MLLRTHRVSILLADLVPTCISQFGKAFESEPQTGSKANRKQRHRGRKSSAGADITLREAIRRQARTEEEKENERQKQKQKDIKGNSSLPRRLLKVSD